MVNIDTVAIILARGGSERLPGKNLLRLCGKPLINWTIEAAKRSEVDFIIVSSDDENILFEAESMGVNTMERTAELATNTATSFDAIVDVLNRLKEQGILPRRVMLLQPTSPLRTEKDINDAVDKMDQTNANSVISVCEVEHSPLWCNTLNDDGCMDEFIPEEIKNKRSQDLSVYYRINGAVYLANIDKFLEYKGFIMENSQALVMQRDRSIDIDCQFDFEVADVLMRKRINEECLNDN